MAESEGAMDQFDPRSWTTCSSRELPRLKEKYNNRRFGKPRINMTTSESGGPVMQPQQDPGNHQVNLYGQLSLDKQLEANKDITFVKDLEVQ